MRQTGIRARILLFSDLCLDRPYLWAPPATAEARRGAQREALVEILTIARQHSVDAIACAGDLFDRHTVKPTHVEWLITAFRSADVPVLIAPGNHDFIGALGGYTRHQWPSNVSVFETEDFAPVRILDDVTIWGAAHTEAHRAASLLRGVAVDRPGFNLALFHGAEVAGYEREPDLDRCADFDEGEIAEAGFDHALVGHYQRPHFGRLHTYPGAPMAHDFATGPSGGAVLLTLSTNGGIEREYLPTTVPQLHDLEVDVSDAESSQDVVSRAVAVADQRAGVIRIRLTGRLSPWVILRHDEFVDQIPSASELIVELDPSLTISLGELEKEPTIRGQYVRDVVGSELTDDERLRSVLLIGLRALAGMDDMEGLA